MNGNGKRKGNGGMEASLNPDSTPILYTDNIHMISNRDGVVLNVMQRIGQSNQMRIVSRIGMSREHAKKFVQKLGELILVSEGGVQTGKDKIN